MTGESRSPASRAEGQNQITEDWPRRVYDLGAAEGFDTAEYLSLGYNVIAVEPRPDAAAALQERFANEIVEGRVVVIAKAIAERSGTATFWVCNDNRFLSTSNKDFMTRWGREHRAITVPTTTFRELLDEFGRATYWKIDMEGSDHLCLVDPGLHNLPRYLSVEIVDSIDRFVGRLSELGYRRFKLISQLTFDQPSAAIARTKVRFHGLPAPLRRAYRQVARTVLRVPRRPRAASGSFGDATPGHWQNANQVIELARLVRATDADTDWYDLHAALGDS